MTSSIDLKHFLGSTINLHWILSRNKDDYSLPITSTLKTILSYIKKYALDEQEDKTIC